MSGDTTPKPDFEGFAKAILEQWPTGDIDGADLFELSVSYGMISEIPGGYDPEHHIDAEGIGPERGDPWYEYTFRGEAGAGLYSRQHLTARIAELEAELAAREARGVRVKPLEWVWNGACFSAFSLIGQYSVAKTQNKTNDKYMVTYLTPDRQSLTIGYREGLETAKAAAQADYERRILAALEKVPTVTNGFTADGVWIRVIEDGMWETPVPAPVTVVEAARVLLDATPSELERGINALHIAANSDHGADVCLAQALRALADAGEAGNGTT